MKYERIRDLREDNELTQEYMGKILNVSQRTYSRYENDERAIPIEILSKLADYYGTSVDYIIESHIPVEGIAVSKSCFNWRLNPQYA